jgi:spore germination protein GerM
VINRTTKATAKWRFLLCPLWALVSAALLSACVGRVILHGSRQSTVDVNKNVLVWFVKPSPSGLSLTPVKRPCSNGDRLTFAVKELLEGPSAAEAKHGLGSEIPRGTILLDVQRRQGQAEINVSQRFATGDGTSSLETRLEQLRKTVTSVAGGTAVFLSVEGKRLNVAGGEGIEVHQPINR